MNRLLIFPILGAAILIYFTLTVFILPEQFMSNDQLVSEPFLDVDISESEISLGDSFRISIVSENKGDYGDIHIVSASFPELEKIDGIVQITTYDFTQSARTILPGDEIGASYSGGLESVIAEYPSIEAMNRPVPPNSENNLELVVTPQNTGPFTVFVKSVNIPHVNDSSHYPKSGVLDHQNEHVLDFTVNVNP